MKKILLSLLLAGGVQNSLAMQAGVAASSSDTQPALSEVSKQLFEAAKNKGYFKFLTTMPQLACNTLKDHPKASAATGFVAASCAVYYLYNKFNKSSLSQQPGEYVQNVRTSASGGVELAGSGAEQGGVASSVSAHAEADESFIDAARRGDLNFLKKQLENGADVNEQDAQRRTALMVAVNNGHVEVVRELIAAGADVNAKDNIGWTALMFAAQNGHIGVVQALITGVDDFNAQNAMGRTALMIAAQNGHIGVVQELIAAGTDFNAQNAMGRTALMIAAARGHIGVVQELLRMGANFNAHNTEGGTALMCAAYDGHVEVVRALIAFRADVDAKDNIGWTALMCAATKGHVGVVQALIAGDADFNAQNAQGMTALMIAAQSGRAAVVSELLMHHADIKVQASHGTTAFIFAALNGHVAVVRELLKQRSDKIGEVKMKETEFGPKSEFVIKPQPGHDVETIKSAINIKDSRDGTALIYAAQQGNAEIVRMLLKYWPDLDAEMDGKKAHEWAAEWAVAYNDTSALDAIMLARVQQGK